MATTLDTLAERLDDLVDAIDSHKSPGSAKITFTLPNDEHAAWCCMNGTRIAGVITELDEYLRQQYKYNSALSDAEVDMVQKVRDELRMFIDSAGVSFVWE